METVLCASCQQSKPVDQFKQRHTYTHDSRKIWRRVKLSKPQCSACAKTLERRRNLKYVYNLTEAAYEQMLKKQGGVCAACKQPPLPGKVLAVDHCHKTGKVRGLLHQQCNTALGMVKEDPAILDGLISYLAFHTTEQMEQSAK